MRADFNEFTIISMSRQAFPWRHKNFTEYTKYVNDCRVSSCSCHSGLVWGSACSRPGTCHRYTSLCPPAHSPPQTAGSRRRGDGSHSQDLVCTGIVYIRCSFAPKDSPGNRRQGWDRTVCNTWAVFSCLSFVLFFASGKLDHTDTWDSRSVALLTDRSENSRQVMGNLGQRAIGFPSILSYFCAAYSHLAVAGLYDWCQWGWYQ